MESIIPGIARSPAAGITRAPGTGPQGVAILKVAGNRGHDGSDPAAYIVTVTMENGAVRTIYEADRPSFNIGERIKLVNGSVVRLG
ncbi:MAG: hypothetical protein H7X76_06980 [Prolixibacteraceae bacterium]|nr:hypothetical protein [Burkholderiales bacterium]